MGDDENNIPRRLRRFYRKGEPIPPELQSEEKPHGEQVLDNEPWMNAHQPAIPQQSAPRRRDRARGNPPLQPSVQPPRFEKVLEQTQKPAVTPMDHALGLSDKRKFEERLPQDGDKAIQDNRGKKEEIEHTLQELKELAALGSTKDSKQGPASFHFTPVGGTPTPPSPVEKAMNANPPALSSSQLSPRERMEQRRQGRGMPPAENPRSDSNPPQPMGNNPPSNPNQGSTHFRRRMGQLSSSGESAEEPLTPSSNAPPNEELGNDFKDLFDDPKKKKKKGKDDEDDLSLDEDMPVFEDEK
jgi:hypothetical protein